MAYSQPVTIQLNAGLYDVSWLVNLFHPKASHAPNYLSLVGIYERWTELVNPLHFPRHEYDLDPIPPDLPLGIKLQTIIIGTSVTGESCTYQTENEISWDLFLGVMRSNKDLGGGGWVKLDAFNNTKSLHVPGALRGAVVTSRIVREGPNWISGFRLGGVKLAWVSPSGEDFRTKRCPGSPTESSTPVTECQSRTMGAE